jgi:hypothetical protein
VGQTRKTAPGALEILQLMHDKWNMSEVFLQSRAIDTVASLAMQFGNIVMNLMMAGFVFGPPGWCAEGRGDTSKNIRAQLHKESVVAS